MPWANVLKKRALEIGFDLVGIAPVDAWNDLGFSRRWVEQGYGGEMHYLKNPKRDDPRRVLPSTKSVICVGLVYNASLPYSTEVYCGPRSASGQPFRREGAPRAWISRYAWGKDYHQVMRVKLETLRAALEALASGVETRVYVDTGPVVERAFARLSGIGWMGKNTCLINEQKGSWFFLGVILTNLELMPDLPAPDRCGSCTRCLEACPTGALVAPYVMDASRCIAYLTIELQGPTPAEFRHAVGANVFGCDICQDVCPWNSRSRSEAGGANAGSKPGAEPPPAIHQRRHAGTTPAREFQPLEIEASGSKTEESRRELAISATASGDGARDAQRPQSRSFSLFHPPLEALASLSEQDFRRLFAHSPIKRAKYRGWLRNLCLAMGNSGDERFAPWLEQARQHPDAAVREHAEWALEKIRTLHSPG